MATRKEFCDAMYKIYQDHGVYIPTGNGEYLEQLTIGQIKQMEYTCGRDPKVDIRRDLTFIGNCYEQGFDMSRSRAGDCSGIIVGCMRDLKIIGPKIDYRAKDFQSKSQPVPLKELQAGDLVFDKKEAATHVGVYDGKKVIESKGRDYGVVYRSVSAGPWVIGGRLNWFDDPVIPILTRNLYYRKQNLMTGEDVRQCQQQLNKKGFNCGNADGVFGQKTSAAVISFQKANKLQADGIVGPATWQALFK